MPNDNDDGITRSGGWVSSGLVLLTGPLDTHPPECVVPDDVLIQLGPPDHEHLLLETCRSMK